MMSIFSFNVFILYKKRIKKRSTLFFVLPKKGLRTELLVPVCIRVVHLRRLNREARDRSCRSCRSGSRALVLAPRRNAARSTLRDPRVLRGREHGHIDAQKVVPAHPVPREVRLRVAHEPVVLGLAPFCFSHARTRTLAQKEKKTNKNRGFSFYI